MCRRKLYKILLVITGLLVVCGGYAQDPSISTDDYTDLGIINATINADDAICPSITGTPSENTFRVEVVTADVGDTFFEWIVYGGVITANNGSSPQSNQAGAPQSVDGVPYYYISHDNYSSGTHSQITIQWHTDEMANAWVAVRQSSEWGCNDGRWSVYTQEILNEAPILTLPADPDMLLAYNQREDFELPLNFVNDYDPDGCPNALTYTYEIEHPTWANTTGTYDAGDDPASRTVDLEVGDNIVTWTISDGHKTASAQYTITVDEEIAINHVAWRNPTCSVDVDGELYVHDVAASSLADISYQISSDGGSTWGAWQSSPIFNGLAAGTYHIQMQVEYTEDTQWSGTTLTNTVVTAETYQITLQAMAANAITSALPTQGADISDPSDDDPGLTVSFTNCVDSEDGSIEVDPILSQNSSLSFNGSSHQMPLNLSYTTELGVVAVAAWIKTTSNNGGPILSFDPDHYFQLRVTTGAGNCFARFQTSDGEVTSNQPVNDGQWHLIVGVYDGTNNAIRIFVDGYPTEGTTSGTGTIGDASLTRYGYIGRLSNTASFGATTSGSYYSGQIADVAIFESLIDSTTIDGFLRNGFASYDHRWLLNHNPTSLSATSEFSDVLDLSGLYDSWARFIDATGHPTQVTEDAPVLKQWDLVGTLPGLSIYDLDLGNYILTVKDILGCGVMSQTYEIQSGDESVPFLLTNSALFAPAVLSDIDGSNIASLANDGMLGSTGYAATPAIGLNESWRVDMGATRTVHQVKIWFNTARSNFRVALSQDGVNLIYILDNYSDVDISEYELTVNGTAGRNGRFLHVIDIEDPAVSLQLNEVEVWTNQEPVVRNFYLGTNQCTYTINNAIDGSTDPIPWDVCGGATTYYDDGTVKTTINGLELDLNIPVNIDWQIEDNNPIPITNNKVITYLLLDTIAPTFVTPLPEAVEVINWCNAQDFSLEIPDYDDNYVCLGDVIIDKMELFKGTDLLNTLTYPDMDPEGNDSLTVDPSELTQGNHEFIWVITDEGGNVARDTQRVYVQTKPEVVNATVVNATCNGEENGQVIVWNITKDATETDVEYWLVQGSDTIKSNDYFIDGIAPGTYQLSINVNECESDPYGGSITIGEPPALTINETLYPPACFVNDDGVIEVNTTGGDIYNVLHFPGDAGSGLSVDYEALDDMTDEGTVECWVYLDTLSTDNENSDAAFITKGATSNDFALQMESGVLTFNLTNDAAATASVSLNGINQRQWYHVAATWNSDGDVSLYIHDASGLLNSTTSISTFTGPAQASGTIRLGSHATNNTFDQLHGFMRNARLWKRALSVDEIYMNLRLNSPIDPTFDCVANFPMTNTLINFSGAAISSVPSEYVWQDKAYWWEGYDYTINWRDNLENLSTGDYTVWAYDIFGCSESETIHLPLLDDEAPVFRFTNADNTTEEPYSDIHREADTGECFYTSISDTDLDPIVTDDNCGVVVNTWFESPDIADGSTLNGVEISGTVTVTWYATDGQNIADTTVVYVISDNQPPEFPSDNEEITLFISDRSSTDCFYTVESGELDRSASDNCGVVQYINNYDERATLDGIELAPGLSTIRWIANDAAGNSDTLFLDITVIDDIPPTENCVNHTAYLGDNGNALITAEDIYGSLTSGDNCNISSVSIALNVALNEIATQDGTYDGPYGSCDGTPDASKANDGDRNGDFFDCSVSSTLSTSSPQWQVDLGTEYEIRRIDIYNRTDVGRSTTNLTDFTIEIATDPAFASIEHTENYSGTQSDNYTFTMPTSTIIPGRYVRITSNSTGDRLEMAEVEVYGSISGTAVQNVALNKDATMWSSYHNPDLRNVCEQNVPASRAVDGLTHGSMFEFPCTVTHTDEPFGDYEWWQVDLGGVYRIDDIVIHDRTDVFEWNPGQWIYSSCRLYDFYVLLADNDGYYPTYETFTTGHSDSESQDLDAAWWSTNAPNTKVYYNSGPDDPVNTTNAGQAASHEGVNPYSLQNDRTPSFVRDTARYVRIWMDHSREPQNLAEVQVFGVRVDMPEVAVNCDHLLASPVNAIITAADNSGNITQCNAQITVVDNILPTARVSNQTVQLNDEGLAIIRGIDVDNGSFDNCGIKSYLVEGVEEYELDCSNLDQAITLTFTVVDYADNAHSVDFEVIVEDKEGPVLACPASGTVVDVYLNNYGELTLDRDYILDYILPGSEDNCGGEDGIITIESDIDYFNCDSLFIDKGTYNINITASDIYANESTCVVEIAVRDTIAPRVRARNATITVGALDQPFDLTLVDNASYDNCDIEDFWSVPATYGTCQSQTVEVVLWAIDRSGNFSSDTADIVFTPSFKILSFGLDECSSTSGGTEWAASIEGNLGDLHYNWVSDDNHAHFDGATTSTLERPGYTTVGGNHDCWVTLTVTDSIITATDTIVCIATKQQLMSFKPGNSNQHFNNITTEYEEACYGETVKYYVPSIDISDPDIEVVWTIESPDETGNIYGGEIIGDDGSDTVTVRWNSSPSYSGLRTFQGSVLASVFITVPNPPPANKTKTCRDGYFFNVSVYDNPDPDLQILGGGVIPNTVCPGDTLIYEVINLNDEFTWDWMPITQGEVIEGGQSNNPTMTVVWGSVLNAVDSIKVIAYNFIGCSDSVVSLPITITDTWPPVFTSTASDFDITLPTNPGQCVAWLTNLPIPEAQDECGGTVCSESTCYTLTYSINGPGVNISNKAGNLFNTENLPVGTHTVTWVATDLGGLTNTVPFTYDIIVEDQQAPQFSTFPADTTLIAGDDGCYMIFNEPTNCIDKKHRQTIATDNCDDETQIEYNRAIYKLNELTSLYELEDSSDWQQSFDVYGCNDAYQGIGIDRERFDGGVYRVYYYTRDGNGNERVAPYFTVTVLDNNPPSITEAGTSQFFDISVDNDFGTCSAVVDLTKPAGFAWASDNCTSSNELNVTATRSDGRPISWDDTSESFPVGETTVTWRIEDLSGNFITRPQVVTVNDVYAPEIDATTVVPAKLNYTWCEKGEIKLPVPDVSDNCNGLDSLRVNVNTTGSTSVNGVSLSASTASIEEGNNFLLAAYISPSDASNQIVSWGSSNNGIASVSNGLVTGNSPGTATITVTTSDGGYTATCEVTVSATSMGPNLISNGDFNNGTNDWNMLNTTSGSSLSISSGEMRINISNAGGETWQPQMVQDGFSITNGVTYYVSFDARATANRNFQHTVNTGPNNYISFLDETVSLTTTMQNFTYTFTAGSSDTNARFDFNVGQNNSDIFIDNVELRVANASSIEPVTGVNLTPASTSVGVGNTKLLAAAVAPAAATNQSVTWSSNNTAVATVSADGLVSGVAEGTATITVETDDGNFTDDCVVTVTSGGSVFFTQLFTVFPIVATQTDLLPITAEGTYSVQWIVWDRDLSSLSTPYDISVERQPRIIDWDVTETTCPGATDGSIQVTDISVTSGADVEYSIQPVGSGYQSNGLFSNLGAGNYNYLHITANGCESPYVLVNLDQLPPYEITGTLTPNWCAEDTDGEISITTTGGAFSNNANAGGTFSWHYSTDGSTPDNTYPNVNTISGVNISSGTDGTSTISNLPSGQYYVYYTDASGSCNAGANFTVLSEDNESPDVQPFLELPIVVYTDEDVCTHTVTPAEATVPTWGVTYDNTNLVPATQDVQGCSFDSEYQITNTNGTSSWLTTIQGEVLTQNVNQVFMQFDQNDNTYPEEYVYTIRVDDDQEPDILTQSISGALDENGELLISANALDNGSFDNCPGTLTYKVRKLESDPWADEVLFDCDDVGSAVSVFFKVTDASGNADSTEISGITIADNILPTVDIDVPFEYSYCATIRSTRSYVEDIGDFTLNADDYSDNCSVNTDQIEYQVVHESTEGTITITQGWTTGAAGEEGNAAYLADGTDMPFYVGENRIYFRVSDQAGNTSAGKECFTIIVFPQPDPGEIND